MRDFFSLDNAVCSNNYHRRILLAAQVCSGRVLTDSVLQRENKRVWARSYRRAAHFVPFLQRRQRREQHTEITRDSHGKAKTPTALEFSSFVCCSVLSTLAVDLVGGGHPAHCTAMLTTSATLTTRPLRSPRAGGQAGHADLANRQRRGRRC